MFNKLPSQYRQFVPCPRNSGKCILLTDMPFFAARTRTSKSTDPDQGPRRKKNSVRGLVNSTDETTSEDDSFNQTSKTSPGGRSPRKRTRRKTASSEPGEGELP